MTDRISVTLDGPVRAVTLTRPEPEKGNAMDAEMLRAVEEAFDPDPARTRRPPNPFERRESRPPRRHPLI